MKDRLTATLRHTAMATVALLLGCTVFATAPLYAQVTDTTTTDDPMMDDQGQTDIVQALQEEGDYTKFADALQRTGLDQSLNQEQSFTIFAPNDEAFDQMETSASEMDEQQLADVLRYHIIFEQLPSQQLSQMTEVQMGNGETVQITSGEAGAQTGMETGEQTEEQTGEQTGEMQQQEQLSVAGANIVDPDIQAQNGVIHGIDRVLQPTQVGAE